MDRTKLTLRTNVSTMTDLRPVTLACKDRAGLDSYAATTQRSRASVPSGAVNRRAHLIDRNRCACRRNDDLWADAGRRKTARILGSSDPWDSSPRPRAYESTPPPLPQATPDGRSPPPDPSGSIQHPWLTPFHATNHATPTTGRHRLSRVAADAPTRSSTLLVAPTSSEGPRRSGRPMCLAGWWRYRAVSH